MARARPLEKNRVKENVENFQLEEWNEGVTPRNALSNSPHMREKSFIQSYEAG